MDLLKYALDKATDKNAIQQLNDRTSFFKVDSRFAWYDKKATKK